MGYYNRIFECPFYRDDERGAVMCVGGRVVLRKTTLGEYMREYCCSVEGWQRCSIAQALERQYEGE